MRIRTYTELSRIDDFPGRYRYLRLHASVGVSTFGFDRYLNQALYTSREWRRTRLQVIDRDRGCDLGIEGYEIHDRVYIHHMNPVTADQILHGDDSVFDLEYLITVSNATHNAIHFGDENMLAILPAERRPGDTQLW